MTVVGNLSAIFGYHTKLSGTHKFYPLTCLDFRPLCKGEVTVLWAGLAKSDEGRCLGQAINMSQVPTELSLYQFNGCGCGWGACCKKSYPARGARSDLFWRIRDADQHRRSRAEHGNAFFFDELKDERRFNFAKANMGHTPGCVNPGEGPAVCMEHRQGPQIPISWGQVMMDQGSHDINVRVAVGNHDPLGPRGGPTGVIDGNEI